MSTSFFLSRRALKASPHSGMPIWQDKLFIALAGSAIRPPTISIFRPSASWRLALR
jgi:K+ transporter